MFPQEFEPRLNSNGMMNKHIWYSDNPFYQAGYGLPNCTCYSWGRFWEVTSFTGLPISTKPQLPLSDAGTWFARVDTDIYQKSDQLVPQLGAVICFSDDNGGAGHVANVEEIRDDGETIVCSNSAWGGSYFYLTTLYRSEDYKYTHFTFQGFIYHPLYPPGPIPERSYKKKPFPWYMVIKKKAQKRLLINY